MKIQLVASVFRTRNVVTRLRPAAIALLVVALLGGTTTLHAVEYSRVVMFGDSLSDTGNMYRLSKRKIPSRSSYYKGRYSNGSVWLEYIRSKMGIRTQNLAHGGALSGYTNVSGSYPGLRTQIDTYLAIASKAQPQNALHHLGWRQ